MLLRASQALSWSLLQRAGDKDSPLRVYCIVERRIAPDREALQKQTVTQPRRRAEAPASTPSTRGRRRRRRTPKRLDAQPPRRLEPRRPISDSMSVPIRVVAQDLLGDIIW